MRKKTGVNGLRKHYGTKMRRGTKSEHNRKAGGKNIRYALLMLENAGLVGTSRLYSQDGQTITMGKALTKKGTMDMDRIAAQTIKKKWVLHAAQQWILAATSTILAWSGREESH